MFCPAREDRRGIRRGCVPSVRCRSTASGKWNTNQSKGRQPRGQPPTWALVLRTKSAKSRGPERVGLRRAIFSRLRVRPVNRSDQKTLGNLPLSAVPGQAESTARMGTGGQGGIRTHGTLARTPVFETGAIDHSATCPARAPLPSPGASRNPVAQPFRRRRHACQMGHRQASAISSTSGLLSGSSQVSTTPNRSSSHQPSTVSAPIHRLLPSMVST